MSSDPGQGRVWGLIPQHKTQSQAFFKNLTIREDRIGVVHVIKSPPGTEKFMVGSRAETQDVFCLGVVCLGFFFLSFIPPFLSSVIISSS